MSKRLALLISMAFLLGCDANTSEVPGLGSYSGEFTVFYDYSGLTQHSSSGNAVLTIDEKGYHLDGDPFPYPPYSAGLCEIGKSKMSFQDTIVHTADFDGLLIIHGAYLYTYDGKTLDMSQVEPEHDRKYRYILTKD